LLFLPEVLVLQGMQRTAFPRLPTAGLCCYFFILLQKLNLF
jgi:hypothetical protein